MKKILSVCLMSVFTLCLVSTVFADSLTKSQKVGKSNSPAALMSIRFNESVSWYKLSDKAYETASNGETSFFSSSEKVYSPVDENLYLDVGPYIQSVLEKEGGFTFVGQETVSFAIEETIEKNQKAAEKKKNKDKSQNVSDVIFGKKSLGQGIVDDMKLDRKANSSSNSIFTGIPNGYYGLYPRSTSYNKAVKKATKCKKYVYALVYLGVIIGKGESVPTKAYVITAFFITDEDGELVKEVNALKMSEPVPYNDFLNDNEVLFKFYPDLIERSLSLAASNLDKKDTLFNINDSIIKADTDELVSEAGFAALLDSDKAMKIEK